MPRGESLSYLILCFMISYAVLSYHNMMQLSIFVIRSIIKRHAAMTKIGYV